MTRWLHLLLTLFFHGYQAYVKERDRRQVDVDSGAADQRSADAAANLEAEKKAEVVSAKIDALSDAELAADAGWLFSQSRRGNAGDDWRSEDSEITIVSSGNSDGEPGRR